MARARAAAPALSAGRVRQRSVYVSPWRIDITVRDGITAPASQRRLSGAIAAALDAAGAPAPATVGLILSGDRELAELNATHMGAAGPTDVLSFPLLPPTAYPDHPGGTVMPPRAAAAVTTAVDFVSPGARHHLGEIVVSVERAIAQASAGRGGQTGDVRWSARDELLLLVTHGALHLCGWDHAEPTEEAAMRALELRLLAEAP